MVVLVIAAILLAVAVPSFQNLIKRNNVDSMQSKLASALSTARTEAASRNKVMTICPVNEGQTGCQDASGTVNWDAGWVIFEDDDRDAVVDTDETLIDVYVNSTDYTITAAPATAKSISFSSQGFLAGASTPALLKICDPDNEARYARGLYVNSSGLVMKTRDTSGSGVHNDPANTSSTGTAGDLTCP